MLYREAIHRGIPAYLRLHVKKQQKQQPPTTDPARLERLTPLQYHVTQEQGTERPFSGEYVHTKDAGVDICVVCGSGLFQAETKQPLPIRLAQLSRCAAGEWECWRGDGSKLADVTYRGSLYPMRRAPRPSVPTTAQPTGMRDCNINSASLQLAHEQPSETTADTSTDDIITKEQ